jgi:CBS domain-containing protein
MQMTTIRQLLDQKGRNAWSVRPDATVSDAVAEMANRNVGSLVVMDGAAFVGMVTERHLLRNAALPAATLVRDIMETRVLVARPEHSIEQCMALMTEKRVRHLPVLEGGDLIGIISIGDLVKSVIADQKFVIDQMEHYIHGHR